MIFFIDIRFQILISTNFQALFKQTRQQLCEVAWDAQKSLISCALRRIELHAKLY